MLLTQVQCAYIAGIIDGEGCISIRKVNKSTRMCTVAKLSVRMTHRPIIKWLAKTTKSGYLTLDQAHPKHPNWKDSHEVVWNGAKAAFLLRQVFPYLIIKKRQAEIVIEWVEIQANQRHNVGGRGISRKYDIWVLEAREKFISEMKRLNQRGHLLEQR